MIEVFIFVNLLIVQILFALYAVVIRRGLDKEYNDVLGHQINAAETLEQYVRIFRKVDLNVNAEINVPAFALNEFLLINRDKMYLMDLYTNYYLLYQLELSKSKHKFKRKVYVFQNFLFFSQFVFFILGLVLNVNFALILSGIAIGLQIFLIVFGFFAFSMYELVLYDAHDIAKDILTLDDYEETRAWMLKNDLKLHVFEYPFDMLIKIVRFVLPPL